MFCQIATGSLLLSAIGVPRIDDECLASFGHTTLLRLPGQRRDVDLTVSMPVERLLRLEKPCHRVPIAIPFFGNSPGECISPSAAADRPPPPHRHLLRDLPRRR